jgi:hypothetical protein
MQARPLPLLAAPILAADDRVEPRMTALRASDTDISADRLVVLGVLAEIKGADRGDGPSAEALLLQPSLFDGHGVGLCGSADVRGRRTRRR